MKEILEQMYNKKIEHILFSQCITIYSEKYPEGEVYYKYNVKFVDMSETYIPLSEKLVNSFIK